jgi:putative membrane protein
VPPNVTDPWRFVANPEVYVLVAFLIGAYLYSVRVLGPRAVSAGRLAVDRPIVTRVNVISFVGAMAMLFAASSWPIHQISEQYLYSAHMLQHMMLSYFLPPLVLLATPSWLLRVVLGSGRTWRVVRSLCRPVPAALLFSAVVMLTHVPALVNASTNNGILHYTLHVLVVVTGLGMWMPVLGPIEQWRMSDGAKPIYLFLESVIPTVPAGWLTFAEGTVYKTYNTPVRVWGLSPTEDQQIAGAIMKLGGSTFLWVFVVYYFFKRFEPNWKEANALRRRPADEQLTFADVQKAFDGSDAPHEDRSHLA